MGSYEILPVGLITFQKIDDTVTYYFVELYT